MIVNSVNVFVSYAKEDRSEGWLDWLKEHLEPFQSVGLFQFWYDDRIEVGEDWDAEIIDHLVSSNLYVLMISPSFFASRYIREKEMPHILARYSSGSASIFPLYVRRTASSSRAYSFQLPGRSFEIASLQGFNDPEKPLSSLSRDGADKVFSDLAERIANLARTARSDTQAMLGSAKRVLTADPFSCRVLSRKLGEDFSNSVIHNRDLAIQEADKVRIELRNAGLLGVQNRDPRISPIDALGLFPNTDQIDQYHSDLCPWHIHSEAWKGKFRPILIDQFRLLKEIRFGSASIHPSVEAALLYLSERGLGTRVDFVAKHGIDQVTLIERRGIEYDFLIVADANMFQLGETRCYNYRYLMPIFRQSHHFISRRETDIRHSQLVVARDSSAHHQLRLGIGTRGYREASLVEIDQLPEIIRNIEAGQTVLAWEPLRTALAASPEYISTLARGYKLSTSLYCHRSFWPPSQPNPYSVVGVFVEAFIAAWNYMRRNPSEAAALLASNGEFMQQWNVGSSTSMAYNQTPEVSRQP